MAWTEADIPDLTDRVAVVTGANGGLGLATAEALAGAGAQVVMAARNQDKAASAETQIGERHPGATLEVVELDLGDLGSVRRAADEIRARHKHVDILVNNAGLIAAGTRQTADGFEMQFGVNHLGHFALTGLLLPELLRADRSRVVTITSTSHHLALIATPANTYRTWRAYARSKLANYYFGLGLDRRFREAGVSSQSLIAHPGISSTNLQSGLAAEGHRGPVALWGERLWRLTAMTPKRGARPQLRAATDPQAAGGEFYAPRYCTVGAAVRRPVLRRMGLDRAIDRLWGVSEEKTGVTLDVTAAGS